MINYCFDFTNYVNNKCNLISYDKHCHVVLHKLTKVLHEAVRHRKFRRRLGPDTPCPRLSTTPIVVPAITRSLRIQLPGNDPGRCPICPGDRRGEKHRFHPPVGQRAKIGQVLCD